jgi:hypothetical protein
MFMQLKNFGSLTRSVSVSIQTNQPMMVVLAVADALLQVSLVTVEMHLQPCELNLSGITIYTCSMRSSEHDVLKIMF